MPQLQSGMRIVVMIRIQMKSQSDLTGGSNTSIVFQIMSKDHAPGTYRMSCAPGTLECHMPLALESVHSGAHPMSKVHTDAHPMSKVHIFADLLQWGCLRSPLSIGGTVLPMLRSSLMERQPQAICHTGSLKHSTHSVPCWYMGRVLFCLL